MPVSSKPEAHFDLKFWRQRFLAWSVSASAMPSHCAETTDGGRDQGLGPMVLGFGFRVEGFRV